MVILLLPLTPAPLPLAPLGDRGGDKKGGIGKEGRGIG